MILDVTPRLTRYQCLHHLLPAVVQFLQRPDLASLPDGRHDIRGNDLYAIVIKAAGKSRNDAQLEVHNDYIDIQVVVQGVECMGWKPRSACVGGVADYDPQKDLQFYADVPDTWVQVQSGQFAMFFPEDAHAPMVSEGFLHKVVIKVAKCP